MITQQSIRYKTYLKEALVEALRPVFKTHPDTNLRSTKVDVDFPQDKADYPAIIVRFFERSLSNAGIGHRELIRKANGDLQVMKHYIYSGDVELAVYALSSYDRDIISDTLVHTLAMGDLEEHLNHFFNRLYNADLELDPDAKSHYITLNTDKIQGFGENQNQAPWMAEDVLVYQTSYRIGLLGEFYSRELAGTVGLVDRVDVYPWIKDEEVKPEGDPTNTFEWEEQLHLFDMTNEE